MKRKDISTFVVLTAAERAHIYSGAGTWRWIQAMINAPEKVIYAAMERDHDKGYLEYGVSLRTAWLTEKGEQKLKELRAQHGIDLLEEDLTMIKNYGFPVFSK